MMTALAINDLAMSKELDKGAMSKILGGYFDYQFLGYKNETGWSANYFKSKSTLKYEWHNGIWSKLSYQIDEQKKTRELHYYVWDYA
jgi:hypothetical protein